MLMLHAAFGCIKSGLCAATHTRQCDVVAAVISSFMTCESDGVRGRLSKNVFCSVFGLLFLGIGIRAFCALVMTLDVDL